MRRVYTKVFNWNQFCFNLSWKMKRDVWSIRIRSAGNRFRYQSHMFILIKFARRLESWILKRWCTPVGFIYIYGTCLRLLPRSSAVVMLSLARESEQEAVIWLLWTLNRPSTPAALVCVLYNKMRRWREMLWTYTLTQYTDCVHTKPHSPSVTHTCIQKQHLCVCISRKTDCYWLSLKY